MKNDFEIGGAARQFLCSQGLRCSLLTVKPTHEPDRTWIELDTNGWVGILHGKIGFTLTPFVQICEILYAVEEGFFEFPIEPYPTRTTEHDEQ